MPIIKAGADCGELMLAAAVTCIMITAPPDAVSIDVSCERLISVDSAEQKQTTRHLCLNFIKFLLLFVHMFVKI